MICRQKIVLTGAVALMMAAGVQAQSTVYASPEGSFDPSGSSVRPFPTIAAVEAYAASLFDAGQGGASVILYGGTYAETPTLDRARIYGASGGVATIGEMGQQSTTFEIATYNVHLFGDALDEGFVDWLVSEGILITNPLHWREFLRGIHIGYRLYESNVDFVALQEVWHPDRFFSIKSAAQNLYNETYYNTYMQLEGLPPCIPVPTSSFGIECWSPVLNSGLGVMTKHNLLSAGLGVFGAESGEDDFFEPFSTKGYILSTIEKDGITIAVFNTHAQAGSEFTPEIRAARRSQMEQLALHVDLFRTSNPDVPIFVVGDLNIRGSGDPAGEYTTTLKNLFGEGWRLGMIDSARADFANRAINDVTSAAANRLGGFFDSGPRTDKRLDYILYTPTSADGTVSVVLEEVETPRHRAPSPMTEDGFSTIELSDHWAVHARFRIVRH